MWPSSTALTTSVAARSLTRGWPKSIPRESPTTSNRRGAEGVGTANGARPSGAVTGVVGIAADAETGAVGPVGGGVVAAAPRRGAAARRRGSETTMVGGDALDLQHTAPGVPRVSDDPVGPADDVPEADGVRDSGDGAEHRHGDTAARAERSVLGRVQERGRVQHQPQREARQPRRQGVAPADVHPTGHGLLLGLGCRRLPHGARCPVGGVGRAPLHPLLGREQGRGLRGRVRSCGRQGMSVMWSACTGAWSEPPPETSKPVTETSGPA